ncbi:MAG: helix-turn-helix transcriptional regulator [Spirochaetes bacterium]|nr:helix-turn-helix transcriptional regulator [Spirochaetota bacterium]
MDFLTIFVVAQTSLLVFILFVMKRNKKANVFFGLFIAILSLNYFSMFLHGNEFDLPALIITIFSLPGISIIGVLIYLYTLNMTGTAGKFRLKDLAHFVIYIVLLGVSFIGWYLSKGNPDKFLFAKNFFLLLMGVGLTNSLVYIIISFLNLRKYNNNLEKYFSDIDRYDMSWLKKLTALSLLFFIIWNAEFWILYFELIARKPFGLLLNMGLLLIIIFSSAYYLINKPDITSETKEMLDELEVEKEKSEKEKYAKQNIDDIMKKEYLGRIRKYMDTEKPYLNENVTIKDLASGMDIPSHHLSIVINDVLNMNFYTFINEYRIKEAIKILNDPENTDANILSIAYRSGFNSKSTFNSVFKKITHKTPSEYRNSLSNTSELAS